MPVGINLRGAPGGPVPNTMLPGGGAPPAGGTQPSPPSSAGQNNLSWAQAHDPYSVQHILAGHAASNQQATRAALGYGASGLGSSFGGYTTPSMGGIPVNAASSGVNPFNLPLNFAFGTAGYYTRATAQSSQQTAAGVTGLNNVATPGSAGFAPGGGAPNVPNFGWGAGGAGFGGGRPPHVPNFGWMGGGGGGGGGGGFNFYNFNYPGPGPRPGPGGGAGGGGGGLLPALGGWMGSRATGSMLAGATGMGLAAEAAKDLYFLPQFIAGKESQWLGNTAQARNYIGSTSIMGQSGGFNSVDFRSSLRRAGERGGDDWLLRTGLGPDEAAQMVGDLGVVPRSTEQATGVARNMVNSRITPGVSGIPTGMLTGIMRDMLGVGATTLDRTGSMNNDLGAIMKQTAQTGQDQLKVLRSIDTGVVGLSTSPGAAGAIGPDTLFQANQRFITTPGGMAGVAGEQSISATQSAFSTVGSNPARTIVASTMVEKLKSEGDLRNFFGGDAWDNFAGTPVGREMADIYLRDVKAGNKYGAMQTLSQGLMQDPTLAASAGAQGAFINNPITNQYGPGQGGLNLASQANMSNMSEAQVIAFNQSLKSGQASGIAANNPLNLSYAGQPGVIGSKRVADGQNIAIFPSMAAGVAASVNQLRRYEKNGLMSPRELAMKWSGSHASEAYIKSVAESMGVGPDAKVNMNDPDMARAYVQGAQPYETGTSRISRADINSGVDLAFGRKSSNPNLRPDGTPDPNVPEYNPAVGTAKGDVLGSGSERTLRQGENLNNAVNTMSDAWRGIVMAVEGLASAVRAAATVQGITPLNALR